MCLSNRFATKRREPISSSSSDGHAVDAEGGGGRGRAEDQVRADRTDVLVHVLEVARDGDLFDGVGELTVLDADAGGALRVVAGDQVYAKAHDLGDIKARGDAGDDLVRRVAARDEIEVAGANAGCR